MAAAEGKNCWGMAVRECDSCKHSPAVLFCRADSAFLCGVCDTKVHGANKFASRHERVWLCEVCEQAPAAVTCKADAAMLCTACDADIHSANPLAQRHERFAVVPFYDSPAVKSADANGTLNPSDEQDHLHEAPAQVPKAAEYFFSDVDPYLDLDYASSVDPRYDQTDSVVPVQAKTAATAVGSPVPAMVAVDGCVDLDYRRPKPAYGAYSLSSSDAGVVPDGSAMSDVTYPYARSNGGPAMGEADREARLMRYREKRKSRKFEKTIRYASRKAYAETRPRIKGRFAKRTKNGEENVYGAPSDIIAEAEYGVVPSF
ncbi:zinc finger protein CONSTANS-LIKE 4-like [Wolffia australiana]